MKSEYKTEILPGGADGAACDQINNAIIPARPASDNRSWSSAAPVRRNHAAGAR